MHKNPKKGAVTTEKDTGKYCKPNCVSEKEILNLAWNYFQQHAQQRLSFFNFFVAFSVLMTTGLISTFQEKYDAHAIGIAIGFMLSLISFVFYKIDDRNKYLTKAGENAIKQIEKHYSCAKCYPEQAAFQIFMAEESKTEMLRNEQLKKGILFRQISHSKSFNMIFVIFFIVGILGSTSSAYFQYFNQRSEKIIIENKIDSSKIVELDMKIKQLIDSNIKLNAILVDLLRRENNLSKVQSNEAKLEPNPTKSESNK